MRVKCLAEEHKKKNTGIAEVTGSNPVEALIFFQASSFQLLKLENSLRGSFFTFIYNRSSYELFHIYLHNTMSPVGLEPGPLAPDSSALTT